MNGFHLTWAIVIVAVIFYLVGVKFPGLGHKIVG